MLKSRPAQRGREAANLLSALFFAATIAGSSSAFAQEGSIPVIQEQSYRSAPARAHQSLVAHQPALDCELAGPEPNTVDAELWARLKLSYEQLCYKQAEILIRKRLQRLAADTTGRRDSRLRNVRSLKALARTVADAPAPSSGVVAVEENAGLAPTVVAPTVTGNVAKTISFDEVASNSLKDANLYFERGIASYRDGDPVLAIADFDLAIEFDPNLRDAYIDQGIAWYRMGNLHRAFDVVSRAVRIEGSHRACYLTTPEGLALAIKKN